MRSPAQHRPGLAAARGMALLYTDPLATAVLYNNDGGQGGGTGTIPSPAEVAARAGQQPPAPPVPPQAAQPAVSPEDEKVSLTQRRLNVIMRDEKEEGRRAAFRSVAEAVGLDPETFDPAKFGEVFKQAEQARQQQLSEEQRRAEELQRREQAIQAREDAAAAREKEAADRDRASRIRAALVTLGATGADLEDAAALLRVADDASDADITKAAEELKARRAEMFGGTPAPQTLPPAPSGGPAGGNAPRQPSAGKDAVRQRARQMAIDRGLRAPDVA